ncbi:outer membrane beta-barrel protein [Vibrio caribbeanicus]|uniref:outer membrane beta-barrel protein n=1 Tax=Vibrio caribbeanicus TaxID=701175 RepID=UPI0030DDD753
MVKNTLCVLAVAMASNSVLAADSHWYVGVDVLNTQVDHKNTISGDVVDLSGVTVPARTHYSDMSKETGFGLNVGTQILLKNQFAVGVEAEYLSFGSFSSTIKMTNPSTGVVYDIEDEKTEMKVTAFNLNIKPKYYFKGNRFYLGAIAGVGNYKVDIQNQGDGRDWGFSYGIEAGYEITPELGASVGYRSFITDIGYIGDESIELELDSFYVGLDYKF